MGQDLGEWEHLFVKGQSFACSEAHEEALTLFWAALRALPEPQAEQEATVRILTAMADSYFHLGRWEECRRTVRDVFRCGTELDDPFLRLRLGQALFELGDLAGATNWLVPLYMAQGRAPFERADPKYLASFRDQLDPPPGGWPEGW